MADEQLPDRSIPPVSNAVSEATDTSALNLDANAVNGVSFVPAAPPLLDLNGFTPIPDLPFMNMPLALPTNGGDPSMFGMVPHQGMSNDEIALYDRQIRILGFQVQERLRSANVLLIGLKALGTEIAKNLVLAGVGTLTILDGDAVTEEDLGSQFFLTQDHVGMNRAEAALPELQKLNPRVELFTDPNPVVIKDPVYFQSFDITIATDQLMDILISVNMSCRMFNRKFYAANTYGMYGFVFADLILHDYIVEKPRSNRPAKVGDMDSATNCVTGIMSKKENDTTIDIITHQETYSPLQLVNLSPLSAKIRNTRRSRMRVTPLLSCLRALFDFQTQANGRYPGHNQGDLGTFTKLVNEKHLELQLPVETLRADFLRSFLQNLGSELSPVAAVLGGFLAQDVINVLGQKEPPLQNLLLFDGEEFTASTFSLHPINDDAMTMMSTNGLPILPMDASVPVT